VKEFELQQTQRFSDQLDDVFAFFADPANLVRITPPWLHFSIRSPQPIDMATGALIDYRIRMRGIPMKWRSEITVWDPPHRFVDEQRIGPYRYWIHEHTFKTSGGFTDVSDHVRYADLRRIFSHRASVLARIFTEIPVTNGARTR
jgi:ligand-binding SRPBCC domain-containing protein